VRNGCADWVERRVSSFLKNANLSIISFSTKILPAVNFQILTTFVSIRPGCIFGPDRFIPCARAHAGVSSRELAERARADELKGNPAYLVSVVIKCAGPA